MRIREVMLGVLIATAAQADRLVYCDQTPGALMPAAIWRDLPAGEGESVVYVTEAAEFTTRLGERAWGRVVVSVRFEPLPGFLNALRDFAQAHGDSLVEIWTWHDAGETIPPGRIVEATGSISVWRVGMTVLAYRNMTNPDPQTQKITIINGLAWPTYDGIGLHAPFTLAEAQAADPQGMLEAILDGDCEASARNRYENDVETCESNQKSDKLQCIALHGPGGINNPPAYIECIGHVYESFIACVRAASRRFERAIRISRVEDGEEDAGGPQ